jgi:hypothetical protein
MPKKLTILGALTAALVFGYFGLFNGTSQGALQSFTTTGATAFDWDVCYGGARTVPSGGGIGCGAGSSNTTVPRNTSLISYTNIEIPPGSRLSLPITYTPSNGTTEWQADTVACAPLDGNNECTALTDVGDVTSRTDLGCDLGQDILASDTGQTGGLPSTWPNYNTGPGPGWNPPLFERTSQAASLPGGGGGEPTGGANDYVTEIVPFPTSGANAFDFQSIDTSNLTHLWIGGSAPLAIPGGPVKLQLATYQSNYASQPGLNSSVALLAGEPSNPPSDAFNCLESPQDSTAGVFYLKTPDADRVIARWNTTISAEDLQTSEIDTILDWQCITVGTGDPSGDTDGDCDPNSSDTNDGVKDIDGDLVPDGVERAAGSDPVDADTDNDGANDYTELFQFTDPTDTDSDNDGQGDAPDETPTNGAAAGTDAPTTGTDALNAADDNCPAVANASQLNTDSMFRHHGIAPSFTGAGNGTGDRSNPTEDRTGDECDTDNDNDDLNNVSEAGLTIIPWSGFTDPGGADLPDTSVCAGPGVGVAPDTAMSPTDGDVDRDYFLDGRECQLRSRPDQSIRDNVLAENCNVAPTVPLDNGCAQPAGAAVGPGSGDEGDGLYLPGGGPASHLTIEQFFRTRAVTTGVGVQVSDYDFPQPGCVPALAQGDGTAGATGPGTGDRDSDRDLFCPSTGATAIVLTDGVEARIYGTSPNQFDSDQDACPDAEEVMDMNGDGNTSSIDQGILGGKVLSVGGLDTNGDGNLSEDYVAGVNFDLNKDGTISSIDQGQLAALISSVGNCVGIGWEDNIDIGRATTNLP